MLSPIITQIAFEGWIPIMFPDTALKEWLDFPLCDQISQSAVKLPAQHLHLDEIPMELFVSEPTPRLLYIRVVSDKVVMRRGRLPSCLPCPKSEHTTKPQNTGFPQQMLVSK